MSTSSTITDIAEQLEVLEWLREFGLAQASIDRHDLTNFANANLVGEIAWALGGWDAGLGIDDLNEQEVDKVLATMPLATVQSDHARELDRFLNSMPVESAVSATADADTELDAFLNSVPVQGVVDADNVILTRSAEWVVEWAANRAAEGAAEKAAWITACTVAVPLDAFPTWDAPGWAFPASANSWKQEEAEGAALAAEEKAAWEAQKAEWAEEEAEYAAQEAAEEAEWAARNAEWETAERDAQDIAWAIEDAAWEARSRADQRRRSRQARNRRGFRRLVTVAISVAGAAGIAAITATILGSRKAAR